MVDTSNTATPARSIAPRLRRATRIGLTALGVAVALTVIIVILAPTGTSRPTTPSQPPRKHDCPRPSSVPPRRRRLDDGAERRPSTHNGPSPRPHRAVPVLRRIHGAHRPPQPSPGPTRPLCHRRLLPIRQPARPSRRISRRGLAAAATPDPQAATAQRLRPQADSPRHIRRLRHGPHRTISETRKPGRTSSRKPAGGPRFA